MAGLLTFSSGCDLIGVTCDGITALLCGENSYCQYDEGSCGEGDQAGVCAERPEVCAEIYAPVCGCDDRTYANACEAAAAGVSVRRQGTCPAGGDGICGGIAGFVCDEGQLCKFELGTCGAADQSGVCIEIPEACITVVDEVCGCDEVTYTNECEAERAGVSVLRRGACDEDIEVRICGGLQGLACEEGEFCNFELATCGAADQTGDCAVIPEACDAVLDEVCGCDEMTYSNECEAARAGISLLSRSACGAPDEQICGGIAGLPCDEGEYCQTNIGECCCDFLGVCKVIPEICTEEFAPVCGCDAVTYDNECFAARAAASIDHEGPCE